MFGLFLPDNLREMLRLMLSNDVYVPGQCQNFPHRDVEGFADPTPTFLALSTLDGLVAPLGVLLRVMVKMMQHPNSGTSFQRLHGRVEV